MTIDAGDLSASLADAVAAAGASVVRVEGRARGGASGAVWAADGVVVTAHHAVERDDGVVVTLPDGRALDAALVGRDPGTDLAVLRVDATGLAVPAWVEPEGIRVGQLALALARPGKTVRASLGIVGTFGEGFRTPSGARVEHYLEADADLRPGFSGGLLVDAAGRALGVTTSGLLRGASLALPAPTLRRVVGEILAGGRVGRGYLGVGIYTVRLTPALEAAAGQKTGAVVVAVEPGSPADAAGVFQGDVLLAVDGQPIERPWDLVAILQDRVGREVAVRIARAGAVRDLRATAIQRP